jgi:hypothetical protein
MGKNKWRANSYRRKLLGEGTFVDDTWLHAMTGVLKSWRFLHLLPLRVRKGIWRDHALIQGAP